MRSRGHGHRLRPERLSGKLKLIREFLAVTQEEMAKRLRATSCGAPIYPGHISEFESGKREPSLLVLLAYAKVARVSTDVLIDDTLDLPKKIPDVEKRG